MTTDSPQTLSNAEKRILIALRGSDGLALPELVKRAGFASDDEAMGAASWLKAKGFADIDEQATPLVALDEEGRRYAASGLPERRLYDALRGASGADTLEALRASNALPEAELQIALSWWKRKGLGTLEKRGGETILAAAASVAPHADERTLQDLADGRPRAEKDLDAEGLRLLKQRKGVLRSLTKRDRAVRLTPDGVKVASSGLAVEEELSQLTPDLIQSGAWRNKTIRPYDVNTPSPRPSLGKPHPLVQLIDEIRDIFLELGFQEIEEDYVVPALWNMDALFIPQDHPAREMQDTFYLDQPSTLPIDAAVVDLVRKVHEKGGGTGSRGWGGTFDDSESARALLRTHTTVGTIRHLARHGAGPMRVFSVGRVFRKETMDATHLPEFYQIEGIATEEGADFRMLLGILKEFYKRLGFDRLRWRPAYFPYTEPSMEVEVWTGTKWMELGGCGIFRPEVTIPFGVKTPVLAWGLGLERLAMRRFGLTDIRQLYVSDLEWLRKQPLV